MVRGRNILQAQSVDVNLRKEASRSHPCKSQKRGKQIASKRFRRRVRILMRLRKYERLPYRSTELTSPWDLGGDGKCFYGYHPDKEWYARIMRK